MHIIVSLSLWTCSCSSKVNTYYFLHFRHFPAVVNVRFRSTVDRLASCPLQVQHGSVHFSTLPCFLKAATSSEFYWFSFSITCWKVNQCQPAFYNEQDEYKHMPVTLQLYKAHFFPSPESRWWLHAVPSYYLWDGTADVSLSTWRMVLLLARPVDKQRTSLSLSFSLCLVLCLFLCLFSHLVMAFSESLDERK